MTPLRERVESLSAAQLSKLSSLLKEQSPSTNGAAQADDQPRQVGTARLQLVAYVVLNDKKCDAESVGQRAHGQLPEYMCPTKYIVLDAIPKLDNGKCDYARLPSPDLFARRTQDSSTRENTPILSTDEDDKVTAVLLTILCELLGMTDIRAGDNFFEIGGDSIVAIQLVSRAREAGIPLSVAAIINATNLQSLAATIDHSPVRETTVSAFGSAPLTPIQSWFFSHRHPAPEHWNMGGVLELVEPVSTQLLSDAVRAVVIQHPVLSSRFIKSDNEWSVAISDDPPPDSLITVIGNDGSNGDEDYDPAVRDAATLERMQAQFRLESGWLLRFVVITDCSASPNSMSIENAPAHRLCWVIHHLICDGLSVQILLDGIKSECQRQISHEPAPVGTLQTSSYREWAHQLQSITIPTPAFTADHAPYSVHNHAPDQSSASVSSEALSGGFPSERDCADIVINLEGNLVTQLLQANEAYTTTTNELVLAAVAFAWQSTLSHKLPVDIETHGRDALGDEFDTSGVMGWFTAYFPLSLCALHGLEMGERIKQIKESYRQSREQGRDYLLTKYGHQPVVPEISELDVGTPNLLFNFINTASTGTASSDSSFWSSAVSSIEVLRSPQNHRSHVVELNVLASRTNISLNCRYVGNIVSSQTMSQLIDGIQEELQRVADHCISLDSTVYTPSDFPDIDMDQQDLDEFMSGLDLD